MSPTLLEGLVALILLVVAWQLGTLLAPRILRGLRRAIDQVDQVSQDIAGLDEAPPAKEEKNAKPEPK